MAKEDIRIGKVSSIDYDNGMIKVTYTDKGRAVTANMPYANFNGEYKMPVVGQSVVVAYLSNSSSRGIVLGPVWNKKNMPSESGNGLFRKDMALKAGTAYQRYSDGSGRYDIVAPEIRVSAAGKEELSANEINLNVNVSLNIASGEMNVELGKDMQVSIKNAIVKALEDITIEAKQNAVIKAESLSLEDVEWRTSLSKIMDRLEALDGDSSDKK